MPRATALISATAFTLGVAVLFSTIRDADEQVFERDKSLLQARLTEAAAEQRAQHRWLADAVDPVAFSAQAIITAGDPLATTNTRTLAALESLLVSRLASRSDIDHIRLLSLDGVELIRVNQTRAGPQVADAQALQDKSHRDYVAGTLAAHQQRSLYLSRVELNQENGQIESPRKPVVRVGKVVAGPEGEPAFLLVANLTAPFRVTAPRKNNDAFGTHIYRLDFEGYFLDGGERFADAEFAWLLGRSGDNLEALEPDLWQLVSSTASGETALADFLYQWQTIAPNNASSMPVSAEFNEQATITLLHEIPLAALYANALSIGPQKTTFFTTLIAGWALGIGLIYWLYRLVSTRGIARMELLKSQVTSEETKARRNLVSMISHELRTPASALSMLVDKFPDSPPDFDSWERIKSLVKHQIDLLDDLRISSVDGRHEQIKSRMITTTLRATVEHGVGRVKSLIDDKGITASIITDDTAGQMCTLDRFRVATVVENLSVNVIDHSDATQLRIACSIDESPTTAVAHIRVEDNGRGIKPQLHEKIFEKGYSGNSLKGNTGLGLAIVRDWITGMGGSVQYFDSDLGGAGFEIEIPIKLIGEKAAVEGTPVEDDEVAFVRLDGLSVYVIEDDPIIQELTAAMVQRLGGRVWLANDGLEGLELFKNTIPDLILVDYFMPRLDGVAFVKQLRDQNYHVPIIGMTAAAFDDSSQNLRDAGADIVIIKPVADVDVQRFVMSLKKKGLLLPDAA